jgi:GntR family transcriptional repressor for pyruvate dehydrogenase complex
MEFLPSKNLKACNEILEQIYDAILHLELRKDDWLPSERQIAAQTGISRSSVREALLILTEAGLLESTVGWQGGRKLISTALPANLLGNPIGNDPRLLNEFYEARNIIETGAARLTAMRATAGQLAELEEVVREMDRLVAENPHDEEGYFAIDAHFHRLVVQGSGNSVLFELYQPIMRKLWLLRASINTVEFHSYGLPSMHKMAEAVRARDPVAAVEAIQSHVGPLLGLLRQARES